MKMNNQLLTLFPCATVVNLTLSDEGMCPGDTVVFTCITDTGSLVWYISESKKQLYRSGWVSQVAHIGIFTLRLVSETGSVLISTATAHNVSLDYDGKSVNCSDSAVNLADTIQQTKAIKISINTTRNNNYGTSNYGILFPLIHRTSSLSTTQPGHHIFPHPPLSHHQLGSSTGCTPLCTQLHCHC